jgi:DNA-binding NarL/FixJ family response regulator
MITLLICDDQDVIREGLFAMLKSATDIKVVGTAADGAEAVEKAAALKPDVVLMDLKMPIMSGVQATRRLHEEQPAVRVLVLTTYDADEWVFDAIRAGASGYLLKDTPAELIIEAIRGTATGKAHLDPAVAGKVLACVAGNRPAPPAGLMASLSDRERDVLRLLARGLGNANIAKRLCLSEGTVRNYMTSIFAKLEVTDRTQAAVLALRCGLVDEGEG